MVPPHTDYLTPSYISRFLKYIKYTDTCWLWTGSTNNHGYPTWGSKQNRYAHRVAYRLWVGEIPEDLEIDHICHIRCCVNPDHLRLVTRQENLRRRPPFETYSQRDSKGRFTAHSETNDYLAS